MTALTKYNAARKALAEAKAVDEVKKIRDQAEAMRVYGQQAKDRGLEIDAAEIRMRAERRLGEMIVAQKEAVGLHKGGRPKKTPAREEGVSAIKLDEIGIDYKLSSRAQKMAAVPEEKFNELLHGWRNEVQSANERVTVDLLRRGQEEQQRQARRDLARDLSDASAELSPDGRKFACVYADPAWHRKAGEGNRSYENNYPTMQWDDILAMPVRERLLPDAWLFLWMPRAHMMALHEVETDVVTPAGSTLRARVKLPLAWAIAQAWGCDAYSTCFVWTKTDEDCPNDQGLGLLVRDQDEVLLLFKRGKGLPKPHAAEKFGSNHRERAGEHSRKPEHYRRMIASMTGGLPVLELFARVDADHPLPAGWEAWGNQSAAPASEAGDKPGSVERDAVADDAAAGGTPLHQSFPSAADDPQADLVDYIESQRAKAGGRGSEDEREAWKALGAIDGGVQVSGPGVRGLIGDGHVVYTDDCAMLVLTDSGRELLASLDKQFSVRSPQEQDEDELIALKAVNSGPREVAATVASDLIAKGHAFEIRAGDWGLTKEGLARAELLRDRIARREADSAEIIHHPPYRLSGPGGVGYSGKVIPCGCPECKAKDTDTAHGCTAPAEGGAAAQAAVPPVSSKPAGDDLDIPAFLRRTEPKAVPA